MHVITAAHIGEIHDFFGVTDIGSDACKHCCAPLNIYECLFVSAAAHVNAAQMTTGCII
jgi:hypothetical protein